MGQGFNWQVAQLPYLPRMQDADGNLTGAVVMGQATSNLWFDLDPVSGRYLARLNATETLNYYPDELVYRLTDLEGNVTEFGSFDIIASGMFLSRTDPAQHTPRLCHSFSKISRTTNPVRELK